MAKERNTEEAATDATAAAVAAAKPKEVKTAGQVAAGGAGGSDGRSILLKLEDGTSVKRTDYIRRRWQEKASRGEITKEVNQLTANTFGPDSKAVPYQVIFQATKGLEGGPDKVATAPATAEAAS